LQTCKFVKRKFNLILFFKLFYYKKYSFTGEIIRKLINYSTKKPEKDEYSTGHKFPFNACEILCSQNSFIIDKLIENHKLADEDCGSDDSEYFRNKKRGYLSNDEENEEEEEDEENEENEEKEEKEDNNNDNENMKKKHDGNSDSESHRILTKEKIESEKETIVFDEINNNNNIKENEVINNDKNKNNSNSNEIIIEENQSKNNELISYLHEIEIVAGIDNQKENDNQTQNETETENKNENESQKKLEKEKDSNINKEKDNKKVKFSDKVDGSDEKIDFEHHQNRPENKSKTKKNTKYKENNDININNNNNNIDNNKINNNTLNQESKNEECDKKSQISKSSKSQKSKYEYMFPNLNHFFEFFEEEKNNNNNENYETKYVLSGYFFKIFVNIFNLKRQDLITYCFKHNPEILKKITTNLNQKSVCDCLYKLFMETVSDKVIENSKEIKVKILEDIFDEIENYENEELMNLTELLLDCFLDKNFYLMFISEKKIFEKILTFLNKVNMVNNNINNSNGNNKLKENKIEIYKFLLRIMNNLNENILRDFGANIVTPFKNKEINEANLFSFNSLICSLDDFAIDEEEEIKVTPEEIKLTLDQNFAILSEISLLFINDFIDYDNDDLWKNNNFNTTFNEEKRLLGIKRLLLYKILCIFYNFFIFFIY